ncbi:MAG: response regulator transcription factor [Halopseudomonas yangmingensis]|uniref:DNA-binding response regulator, OmpR family, contains REC and winged-helix (WHTH) domain n=1 Tax=Halopseudomonas yangmingensis TaxID=1720063 RepID=A0A1I4S5L7_9GAMM|nr:response regulator transcription factor [Halopseudomonas yangmingensis]SFM59787.1 DNA-binding response regulator, OmpR family, contains REC and winged-helix (wHTH) domain [Halopseudomonas yangmingensis]
MAELNPQHLLLIDDDQELCELLSDWLQGEGFAVTCAHDGRSGLQMAAAAEADAIILDLMLPDTSGLEVLRELRRLHNTPVLMLSARGEPIDRILGLELGADDYLAKPCDPRELVARLRALLRRSQPVPQGSGQLQCGALRLDSESLLVWRNDELLALTQTEALILAMLMHNSGQLVDRQQLSREVLGKPLGPYDRSLDMHISNLRRKLGQHADGRPLIQSVRGRGYLLRQ